MESKRVLIFPCGSECALEIHEALRYEKYFEVFGATSVENDSGPYVYSNFIQEKIPFITDKAFLPAFNQLLDAYQIDFIFPALDSVCLFLSQNEGRIHSKLISACLQTNIIARSKRKTYEALNGIVPIPRILDPEKMTHTDLPVFLKPDVGQGSQGTVLAKDLDTVNYFTRSNPDLLVLEFLPGREYTIDCFTDRHGELRFVGGRERRRIKAGISVNSIRVRDPRFEDWAQRINRTLRFRGVWFFQVKENPTGEFVLMEIATRVAGASALARNRGVNLPLLSLYDAMEMDVALLENNVDNEIDRTFVNRFRIGIEFDTVYCDFDDCLVVRNQVNTGLIAFLFECVNQGKHLVLLTRHLEDIENSLRKYRLVGLFDEVVHIQDGRPKSDYILPDSRAIFIDDSHRERADVSNHCGILCFGPDNLLANTKESRREILDPSILV